jgi:iron complex outermembrane receptor protein
MRGSPASVAVRLLSIAAITCLVTISPAIAQADVAAQASEASTAMTQVKTFDVPAQAAETGISAFARQAEIQLLISVRDAHGKRTSGVSGSVPVQVGLKQLLAGTNLTARETGTQTYTVVPLSRVTASQSDTSGQPPAAPATQAQSNATQSTARRLQADSSGVESETKVPEITVTASRHETDLARTAMSMAAYGSQELASSESQGVLAVVSQTPGLAAESYGPGRTVYSIRGISSTSGNSPTVGFYLDDIPITPPTDTGTVGRSAIDPDLYDLNRIEVLQGPQGTLYGAGSLGGTIRLITNQPKLGTFSGSAEAVPSYTDHGGWNIGVNAMLNIPIGDLVALRIVGTEKTYDGFIDTIVANPFPQPIGDTRGDVAAAPVQSERKAANTLQQEGVRSILLYRPTDRLDISLSTYLQWLYQGAANTYDSPPGGLAHYAPFAVAEPFHDDFKIYSALIHYDFGPFSLSSSTAYTDRKITDLEDLSEEFFTVIGPPTFLPTLGTQFHTSKQFSQETRLTSNEQERFQWVFGTYYQHYQGFYDARATGSDGWVPVVGSDVLYTYDVPTTREQFAVYGEASYALTDMLKLTAGLRWFHSSASSAVIQTGPLAAGPPLNNQQLSASGDSTTPKVTLSYTPDDHNLVYTTFAKGTREGGSNIAVQLNGPFSCAASLAVLGYQEVPSQYDGDSVSSYEVGSKSRIFGDRVALDGSVFYIDWQKIQQQYRLLCGSSFTGNFGAAISKGVSLQVQAAPVKGLSIDVSGGYTEAYISRTIPGLVEAGTPIQNTPKWTLSQQIRYESRLSDRIAAFGQVSNRYYGASFDVIGYKPDYDIAGLRLGIDNGPLELAFFVDNLTNTQAVLANTLSQGANLDILKRVATNRPRTIGLDLKCSF